MNLMNELLQVSAKLLKHLTNIPSGEERTSYIQEINELLDERGKIVEQLKVEDFKYDATIETHVMLMKLDKGIREKLEIVFNSVKQDIQNLQKAKKHEIQYINPYAKVQVMDGRYYDKKK